MVSEYSRSTRSIECPDLQPTPTATASSAAATVIDCAASLRAGASNAEVAASLFMSEATVKAHVSRLLTKLAVTNRVHIAILVHDAQS